MIVLTTQSRSVHRRLSPLVRVSLPMLLASVVLWLVLGTIGSAAPAALPETTLIPPQSDIARVISQVTTTTLAYELAGLTGERPVTVAGSLYTITTRNSLQTEAISMATRYVYEQLAETGLATTYHYYTYSNRSLRNVVAEKPGLLNPGAIYLVTAHVDDLPSGSVAPGADDNGSGSVAVLMAARLLAPNHFIHTLRFVLFTGEEQGLHGSGAYAADCKARGEDIRSVINLDMIGYSTGDPVYNGFARSGTTAGAPESRRLADVFSDVVGTYDLDLVSHRSDADGYPLIGGSDQWSFLNQGYPAILVIEDYIGGDFTPYYHTVSDTLSTLNLGYFRDLTRASIATLAHLGRLLPSDGLGQLSGAVYDLDTSLPLSSAMITAYWPAYRYTFTATTGASGTFSSVLPVGSYTLTVQPPSAGFYHAVITNILIVTDTLTIQDIGLVPWPRCYLPVILQGQ